MESEKVLPKILAILKHKIFLFVLALLVLLTLLLIFIRFSSQTKTQTFPFYPISEHHHIKPILKMFSEKDYWNLTSYIEGILPLLKEEEKKIALFYQAETLFLQKKWEEAEKLFFEISKQYPDLWQSVFRLGCIAIEKRDYESANYFFSSLKVEHEEINYWKGLSLFYQNKKSEALTFFLKSLGKGESIYYSALIFNELEKYPEAISYFEQLVQKYPTYREEAIKSIIAIDEKIKDYAHGLKYIAEYEKYFGSTLAFSEKKGFFLYYLGRFEEAYAVLSPLVLISQNTLIYSILGNISFALKKYSEAITYYEKAKFLDKKEKKQFFLSLIETFQLQKAIQTILNYLQTEKIEEEEIPDIYRNLIQCFLGLEEYDKAEQYGIFLVSIEEKAENYILLSRIYKLKGNVQSSLATLKEAVKRNSLYLSQLIEELIEASHWEEALALVTNILRKEPYHEDGLLYQARIFYKMEKYQEAKTSLYKLIYSRPQKQKNYEEALFLLSGILIEENKLAEAQQMLEKILSLDSQNTRALLRLSYVLVWQKEWKKAELFLNQLQKQEKLPKNILASVYELLSQVETAKGNKEKALLYKKRAISFKNPY